MMALAQSRGPPVRSKKGDSFQFAPQPLAFLPPIEYVPLQMTEIIECHIEQYGDSHLQTGSVTAASDPILIAAKWKEDKNNFKSIEDGGSYLGSGAFKYGIRVSHYYMPKVPPAIGYLSMSSQGMYNGRPVSIFQCREKNVTLTYTERDNYEALTCELRTLKLAQRFLEGFQAKAKRYSVYLPSKSYIIE